MQPIERYGVIALVFFLVTIAAVVIWGPGKDETEAGAGLPGAVAKQDQKAANRSQRSTQLGSLPLSEKSLGSTGQASKTGAGAAGGTGAAQLAGGDPGSVRPKDWPKFPEQVPAVSDSLAQREAERQAALRTAADQRAAEERRLALSHSAASNRAPESSPTGASKSGAQSALDSSSSQGSLGLREYKVRAGDTLSEISLAQLGTSKRWQEIQHLNAGLDPAKLREGMVIKLPAGKAAATSAPGLAVAANTPVAPTKTQAKESVRAAGTYMVAEGDSLWKIAERELGSGLRWQELEKLNPKANGTLAVGMVLQLPEGAAPTTRASSPLVAQNTPSASAPGAKQRVR